MKVIDQVKYYFCAILVAVLFILLALNVALTHGNNEFRMQVALGMDL